MEFTNRIQDNYLKILEEIGNKALLVSVTKGQPLENIFPLYFAGCRHFGESRLQEALPKIEEVPKDIQWHLIGTLQKNKVRKAIDRFELIHGVDSLELAKKIAECSLESHTKTSLLLQVNTSYEKTKHGFTEESIWKCFEDLQDLESIQIEGLMTMAPLMKDEKVIRQCFGRLRKLRDRLNEQLPDMRKMQTLSMGMSGDYRLAIEEGATLVRIGSALFANQTN